MMRLAVFISGHGSNLQAIIEAMQAGRLPAEICVVVSNRQGAYGLTRAAQAGLPTLYFPLKPFLDRAETRTDYDAALAEAVRPYAPAVIVLAGWMHLLSPAFLNHYPQQVINLHPALPGEFVGMHAIERAYTAFQQGKIDHTGVMVHWVVPAVDAGPVIATATVPIYPADTLPDLEARMHAAEHDLLVAALIQVDQTS